MIHKATRKPGNDYTKEHAEQGVKTNNDMKLKCDREKSHIYKEDFRRSYRDGKNWKFSYSNV